MENLGIKPKTADHDYHQSKLVLLNHESLTVEFTSEASRPQIDDELVDNVVALANTEKTGRCTLASKTTAR